MKAAAVRQTINQDGYNLIDLKLKFRLTERSDIKAKKTHNNGQMTSAPQKILLSFWSTGFALKPSKKPLNKNFKYLLTS